MVKKLTAKRPAKKKTPTHAKKSVKIPRRQDQKLQRRLAQLGLSMNVVAEPALSIFLELDQKHANPAEAAFLYEAAVKALEAAAFLSDDPQDWIKAARQGAKL